ncbi:MAG TPA: LTA synthase family protein [Nitrospirota bacterium]|nr:LTA synthase family protein [Nitrospirota bacterium]
MNYTIQKEPDHSFLDKLKNCAALFGNCSLALLIAFLALRIMEFIYIAMTNNPPRDFWNVIMQALLYDIVSFSTMLPFLFIPFVIVYLSARTMKSRYWIYFVGGSIVIILYAMLIKYFATALVPLGADLFGYSMKEIKETVRSGVTFDVISIFLFVMPVIVFWACFSFIYSRKLFKPVSAFVLLGTGVLLICTVSVLPVRTSFETELSYNLALNKMVYFVEESYAYFSRSTKGIINAQAPHRDERRPDNASALKYINSDYPFLRTDETPDVLGEYFNIVPNRPPNIVFILVEGLGKAFSGPNAYLGSFTPFLDDLAGKSLYWENFLSSQGRTFAALPSILASLPFADKGFSDLGQRMPKHLSLMSILKHNGYRIKFYYGSDLDFDNERLFLQKQGVDVMIGINDYDKNYSKSPGTDWGYPDRELMRKALKMDSQDSKQPYVSFVQTISMHTSYSIPDQEKYLKLFEERMNQLGFDEAQKERHRTYEKIYSTIVYTDEALRFFFEQYAKLPAYSNTIFIITGDHRLPEIPMSTKIDRFHVPLIIFSPMLKRTAFIQSISSQLDITPSLLAFLKKNYHIDTPSTVSWVGTGLDTDPSFRNVHTYPLKHTKTNLIDFISGMYFIDQDTLFSIGQNMDLEPIQDEGKRDQLIAEFNQYRERNDRFTHELKLIPDSLYEQYRPRGIQQGKL